MTGKSRPSVSEVLRRHPADRDTLLSALHEVQNQIPGKTWITDEECAEIARRYGIPVAELDGVISFYTMFARKPRGRHVIRLCDSLSCRICGSLDLYYRVKQRLGTSGEMASPDGAFSLELVNCLGACDGAPNVMIDDELASGLSPDELEKKLDAVVEAES